MGESGPVSWDRLGKAARSPGAAHFDPVALEERLKVARALRAEALARRGADPRPRPAARPAQGTRPSPRLEPDEPAPRLRPGAPAAAPDADHAPPVGPAADGTRRLARRALAAAETARRFAHPLAALAALGLVGSLALPSGPPEAPAPRAAPALAAPQPPVPALQPRVAAVEAPALAAPPAPRTPAAPPATAPPAGPRPAPARPAALPTPAAADPAAPAPEAPPVPAAPPAARVLVNIPSGLSGGAVEPALAALRARGVPEVVGQPTNLTIAASTVRFYNPEDAAAAAEVAALVAPHLPGGRAEARDFTTAPSRAAPGNLEIWVAGGPAPGAAPTQARAPAGVPIRRLVQSVLAPAAVAPARDVTGSARQADPVVRDAIAALGGRP